MTHVCARSWGSVAKGWAFCTLPRGHAETCVSDGKAKPPDAKFYEEQPDAIAQFEKQVAGERLMTGKKRSRGSGNTPSE